jgi:acyl-CoA synthetase (NDP forming)
MKSNRLIFVKSCINLTGYGSIVTTIFGLELEKTSNSSGQSGRKSHFATYEETQMKKFFYPTNLVVFGVAESPLNLAKNIVFNCISMGFKGEIFPVGREGGVVYGKKIITNQEELPEGIDLAVILVPARFVADVLQLCGRKGIHHAIISTGGFREFSHEETQLERDIVQTADEFNIRFVGPNCIGIICTNSRLCTPFNPMKTASFKKGPVSLVVQSGGVTTQCAYNFSEEHLGFSKIISVGNKLDMVETDFLKYLMEDEDTEQIHMYLESIQDGRKLTALVKQSPKPVVIFKSNVSKTASEIAFSHTAALSNDDRIVEGALKQAGVTRVENLNHMTVAARALQLPPLHGNRLAVISMSGGFSVILGDACERYGFECPPLPDELIHKIEQFRRAGVIRMSNPMDFGDVHDIKALAFALRNCLALDNIDGLVLSFMYEPEMIRIFGEGIGTPKQTLGFIKKICEEFKKPIALSFFAEKHHVEAFQRENTFPVFNDPVESIHALSILGNYWRHNNRKT